MSEDRSPTKNGLRGMLVRRAMMKRDPKPKKVKRSKKKTSASRRLFDLLKENFSESSLSEGESTSSSTPF
nr:ORF3 [Torque teno felis virus]